MTGTPAYPDPNKGYLEQDAELMLACTICEEYRDEQAKQEAKRKQVTTLVREQGW